MAERVRLLRPILAAALRADAARRPKSLQAILSNSGKFVHAPCSFKNEKGTQKSSPLFIFVGGEGEIRTHEGCETLPVFKTENRDISLGLIT